MSAVITSSSFTCCEQKDTFASPSFVVIWIAVLFQSFEWSLLISNRLKPKFFEKLSDATPTGINWAFKLQHPAVGISYFRKPHLHVKQHEVVIWCELIVARLGVATQRQCDTTLNKVVPSEWYDNFSYTVFNFQPGTCSELGYDK